MEPRGSRSLEALKTAMINLPTLAVPNFEELFVIESDASGKGIGAVLMQQGRPLAYMSKALSERAQKKSVYERELMAIVLAIQNGDLTCWEDILWCLLIRGALNSCLISG